MACGDGSQLLRMQEFAAYLYQRFPSTCARVAASISRWSAAQGVDTGVDYTAPCSVGQRIHRIGRRLGRRLFLFPRPSQYRAPIVAYPLVRLAKAPGKAYRQGITMIDAVKQFGDDAEAEAWFVSAAPALRTVAASISTPATAKRRTPMYHCNVQEGGRPERSCELPLKWAAFYLFSSEPQGRIEDGATPRDASRKRRLGLAHRIRQTSPDVSVEADETVGGKEKNKSSKPQHRQRNGRQGTGRWRERWPRRHDEQADA